ncbi:MAPEG family protein [Pseudomonas cremoricolorata]|uniref:Microsomal glutathione S-transferase 1 n=1 Tax=Pseudomonas cremoricolorata TaxID=157783 RepID=A0A089WP19_9PSED|nr:MAPEG family protein [Pseudomonas cremoricolorata]AIR90321.1 glutathione metabolism protein [Pseudomonas cremoricolorata]
MNSALAVYAGCVVVLFLKMFALSCYQGFYRLRHKAFTNIEDAAVFKRAARDQELAPVIRASRAWANDLENIPAFFALGGLAVALTVPVMLTVWLSVVFTLARVLHTVAYLSGVQPWRTLCYGVGIVCLAGLCAAITWVTITG